MYFVINHVQEIFIFQLPPYFVFNQPYSQSWLTLFIHVAPFNAWYNKWDMIT